MSDAFLTFFAQATNAAASAAATTNPVDAAAQTQSWWVMPAFYIVFIAMIYFAFFRPQIQAKKQKEETLKTAKTGDKIVTSSGIHGHITNVKDNTVIVKVADNVKLEIEKSHIDRITRPDAADTDKTPAAKA
jgi:preprotein translocase subunit YajC